MGDHAWFRLEERERKNFFWLLLIYGLYVFPLIIANSYYMDDIGRTLNGYAAWEFDGRPAAMLVIDLLNFQWTFRDGIALTADGIPHPVQDLAPYPLLLGVAVFAYVIVLLSRRYLRTKSLPILLGCQALCIMNPFMLENLAFHFDSITMLFAVALTLLCFAFPDDFSLRKLFLWSLALSELVLCLYQPMLGTYITLTAVEILICFYRAEAVRTVLRRSLVRLSGVFAAGMVYKFTVASFLVTNYGPEVRSFLSPFSPRSWELLRQHIHMYHVLLRSYTDALPWMVGGAMLLIFLLFSWRWFRCCMRGGKDAVKKILIYVVGVFTVLFGSFLPMVALEAPATNARTLIFLIGIPLSFGIMTCMLAERREMIAVLLAPLLMFGFYYVYAFGNVLKHQAEQDMMYARQISYDISRLDYEGSHPGRTTDSPVITVLGEAPSALEQSIAAKRQPLMANILRTSMRENDRGWILIRHAFPFDFTPGRATDEVREEVSSHRPEISNAVYDIYVRDNHIIIKFH